MATPTIAALLDVAHDLVAQRSFDVAVHKVWANRTKAEPAALTIVDRD